MRGIPFNQVAHNVLFLLQTPIAPRSKSSSVVASSPPCQVPCSSPLFPLRYATIYQNTSSSPPGKTGSSSSSYTQECIFYSSVVTSQLQQSASSWSPSSLGPLRHLNCNSAITTTTETTGISNGRCQGIREEAEAFFTDFGVRFVDVVVGSCATSYYATVLPLLFVRVSRIEFQFGTHTLFLDRYRTNVYDPLQGEIFRQGYAIRFSIVGRCSRSRHLRKSIANLWEQPIGRARFLHLLSIVD